MTQAHPVPVQLLASRLAAHATGIAPAWLWTADASRVLSANAAGAAVVGAADLRSLVERGFAADHPLASQIRRLSATLSLDAPPRLERLRGIGSGIGAPLACACSKIALDDGSAAILVVAIAPVRPALPFVQRVVRLLSGWDAPIAAFSADGALIGTTAALAGRLPAGTTLTAIGGGAIAVQALAAGPVRGETTLGRVALARIGGAEIALVAVFDTVAAEPPIGAEVTPPETAPSVETEVEAPDAPAPAEIVAAPAAAEAVVSDAAVAGDEAIAGDLAAVADAGIAAGPVDETGRPAAEAGGAPEPAADADTNTATAAEAGAADVDIAAPLAPQVRPSPSAGLAVLMGLAERRHPLRFVWQMDADGRFALGPGEFADSLGAAAAAALGSPWEQLAAALRLDPEGRVAQALASRDTWSGITIAWPLDGGDERVAVELSGLPVFDRDRTFRGYRGFGVCREVARLAAAVVARNRGDGAPAADDVVPPEPAGQDATSAPDGAATPDAAATPADASSPAVPVEPRPHLTVVPPSKNVVPFRGFGLPTGDKRPALSPVEHNAFREIAKALGARVESTADAAPPPAAPPDRGEPGPASPHGAESQAAAPAEMAAPEREPVVAAAAAPIPSAFATAAGSTVVLVSSRNGERAVLDRIPVGVVVYRGDRVVFVNRTLLDWCGHADADALAAAGGLDRLFVEPGLIELDAAGGPIRTLALATAGGGQLPVEGRLLSVPWEGETALMLSVVQTPADDRLKTSELALRAAEAETHELRAILDTATDGVIVIDRDGRVLSANRSAEALFGYDAPDLAGHPLSDLFAPESRRDAIGYIDGLTRNGVASVLNDGREVIGRVRQGGLIPLFMTMGRITDGAEKMCAVFRDITQWKRAEEELTNARRQAEKASSAKSDFLAKISHEVRTPLNAIIGFAEVMMEERFGPVGNERYREYLRDIHASGGHVISLVNDLLDLSKIEAGKLELTFASVKLNDLVQQCVAIMQPQANRERIIIRTSLSPTLPPVVVDARSIRQIVLNLLSNSIKFTSAGGQVIVSTAFTEHGEVVLRVRDTGVGMSDKEVEAAMEPFRQLATSGRSNAAGTGLGLPLTKALAEANRASFAIKSAVNAGTLVEVTFPSTRVLAE